VVVAVVLVIRSKGRGGRDTMRGEVLCHSEEKSRGKVRATHGRGGREK